VERRLDEQPLDPALPHEAQGADEHQPAEQDPVGGQGRDVQRLVQPAMQSGAIEQRARRQPDPRRSARHRCCCSRHRFLGPVRTVRDDRAAAASGRGVTGH
jgi:hypothetical protein